MNKVKYLIFFIFFSLSLNDTKANDESLLNDLVTKWNKANNDKSIKFFENNYADQIIYYGNHTLKKNAINDKIVIFRKYKRFNQFIATTIKFSKFKNGIIKADFSKTVQVNNRKQRTYPSYLLFKKIHNKYYIVGESDLLTDNKLNFVLDLGDERPAIYEYWWLLILLVVFLLIIFFYSKFKLNKESSIKKNITYYKEGEKIDFVNIQMTINEYKGYTFEKFVVGLLNSVPLKLIEWRSDKKTNNITPHSNTYPDLEVELTLKNKKVRFAIECKWRKNTDNGYINWAEDYQIKNYINYAKEKDINVHVAIGIGGEPESPEQLYFIPLEKISYSKINLSKFGKYKRYNNNDQIFYNVDLNLIK